MYSLSLEQVLDLDSYRKLTSIVYMRGLEKIFVRKGCFRRDIPRCLLGNLSTIRQGKRLESSTNCGRDVVSDRAPNARFNGDTIHRSISTQYLLVFV